MTVERLAARIPIYLVIEPLHPLCFPVHVSRVEGAVVVWADPRASRVEATMVMLDELEEWEADVIRAGFGQPPIGEHMDPQILEGDMGSIVVPDSLYLMPLECQREERGA